MITTTIPATSSAPQRGRPRREGYPLRVVTVRMPEKLHQAILDAAKRRKTSMNQLCIAALSLDVEAEPEAATDAADRKEPA